MLASGVDNLAKIHQRITEILPFDLNHDFSQFPHFIKMQKPTCDCAKMKNEKSHFARFGIRAFLKEDPDGEKLCLSARAVFKSKGTVSPHPNLLFSK